MYLLYVYRCFLLAVWCSLLFFSITLKLSHFFSSQDTSWWTQMGSSTPKLFTSTWLLGSVMTRWPTQLLKLTSGLILQNGSMTEPTQSPSAGSLVSNTLVLIHACFSLLMYQQIGWWKQNVDIDKTMIKERTSQEALVSEVSVLAFWLDQLPQCTSLGTHRSCSGTHNWITTQRCLFHGCASAAQLAALQLLF